ncbi:ribosomal protein L6e, partial [Cooperia oncophora]
PHKVNNFPRRIIAQAFIIATKERLDVSGKSVFYVTEQRKTDQKAIDKPILAVIKKNSEHKALFGYLGSRFMLGKRQYPHKMVF